jgi:hypothetical protein
MNRVWKQEGVFVRGGVGRGWLWRGRWLVLVFGVKEGGGLVRSGLIARGAIGESEYLFPHIKQYFVRPCGNARHCEAAHPPLRGDIPVIASGAKQSREDSPAQ